MNCLSTPPPPPEQQEKEHTDLAIGAFAIGWSAADEAHLPGLAEAIGRWLGASKVHVSVSHWKGKGVCDYTYESPDADATTGQNTESAFYEFVRPLGRELTFRLTIQGGPVNDDSPAQTRALDQVAGLIHMALECLFVRQHDRSLLGSPFNTLSDREWEVCQALDGPAAEKLLADQLSCSPHTLHTYVKSIYRKMQAQSRLVVIDRLRRARQGLRRATLEGLYQAGKPRGWRTAS